MSQLRKVFSLICAARGDRIPTDTTGAVADVVLSTKDTCVQKLLHVKYVVLCFSCARRTAMGLRWGGAVWEGICSVQQVQEGTRQYDE